MSFQTFIAVGLFGFFGRETARHLILHAKQPPWSGECVDLLSLEDSSRSSVEVGSHWYWEVFGLVVHGEVFMIMNFVSLLLLLIYGPVLVGGGRKGGGGRKRSIVDRGQLFVEASFRYLSDLAKSQLGEACYRRYLPFIGTLFLFILGSNWIGALLPWKLIRLPEGDLASPTNNINVTVALAILTSFCYFTSGIGRSGLLFFSRYTSPSPVFLPINLLEDVAKPLSLSFRLFGNVLAEEIVVSVLCLLVPILVPLPVMVLGVFSSAVQALVFSTLSAAYIFESLES